LVNISLEKRIEPEEISKLLKTVSLLNFFNSFLWVDILESSFRGFSARWITARRGNALVGFMPVIFVKRSLFYFLRSLPFGTYGTPVSEDKNISLLLLRHFLKLSTSFKCLDSSAAIFDSEWEKWLPSDSLYEVVESRIVELDGDFNDYRMRKLNSSKRKECNRCERAGVIIRPLKSKEEVLSFYDIYTEMSVSWGGIHPFSLNFFKELFRKRGDAVVMFGAFLNGKLLGGHIDFYFGNMAQAWQAGVSKEANRYGVSPYLVIRAIEEAYNRGIKYFNMGSSGGDEGLIYFKESLGGKEFNYPIVKSEKRWWKWIKNR
jgi:GNAT superfamily N-acetyltransferase